MAERLDPFSVRSEAIRALIMFEASTLGSGIDPSVLRLAKLRTSQLLGSVFCIERYRREAATDGETDDRLRMLKDWRDSALFTRPERAALAWAEAVARATASKVSDDAYAAAHSVFDDEGLLALTAAVAAATAWNQICLSFRTLPPECGAAGASSSHHRRSHNDP